jgi:hypothetical protein
MEARQKKLIIMYHEIQRLRKVEQFSIQRIADHLSINFRTVKSLLDMTEEEFDLHIENKTKRSCILDSYREFIITYLQRYQDTPSAVIHDRLKEHFRDFPKVDPKTVYNYVMMLRNEFNLPKVTASERQYSAVPDLAPGEQAQVDFGQKKLRTSTGKWVKVYFFIMLLCYSRQKFILFKDAPFTTWNAVDAHEKAFEFFKGIPKEIIYDQDSVFLYRENSGDYIMTDLFNRYQECRPFKVIFCRAGDPESKGKVENTVKYIKGNFLFHRTYINEDILNEQSLSWLNRTGNAMIHNTTRKIPMEQWELEKSYLQRWHPLYPVIKENAYRVIKSNIIKYKGNTYSVPIGTYKNDSTHVFLSEIEKQLTIKDDQGLVIANHVIPEGVGHTVINNNHRRNTSVKVDSLRIQVKEFFINSPYAGIFMENIDKLYPRYVRDQLTMVMNAAEKHGSQQAEKALEFCVKNNLFSANDFKTILENQVGDKKIYKPEVKIKPLGDAKTQLIANIEPERSDINLYESIFTKANKQP